ncbi:MerR family DNA-binding transcriptional regulator [Nonomuraea sp. NPDC046570]
MRDLAHEHGLSTQTIRKYEDAGIQPAADRAGPRLPGAHCVAALAV